MMEPITWSLVAFVLLVAFLAGFAAAVGVGVARAILNR